VPVRGRGTYRFATIAEGAMVLDLVPLRTVLLAFAVFYYVVFDGFDLGVGMLHGFAPNVAARSIMMNSIAPIWDGNETWLVFGGLVHRHCC
jgi:cytochrome d ubiquinol oxidase subunit II